jgi:hypothetical protein
MSFLLLDQEGTARDKGIERVCLVLEGIGSSSEDKLIDLVYQRLAKMLQNENIQPEIRTRMENACGFRRQHLHMSPA